MNYLKEPVLLQIGQEIQNTCEIQQAQRARIQKHQKFIQSISQYVATQQQLEKLQRIRQSTLREIDLRYKKSKQNKTYQFPRKLAFMEEELLKDGSERKSTFFDIYSQKQIFKFRSNLQHVQLSRKVKSLDIDNASKITKSNKQIKKAFRIQTDFQYNDGYIRAVNKRSLTSSKVNTVSKIIFPVLEKKVQNLKTQVCTKSKKKIQEFIKNKLITESYNKLQLSPRLKPLVHKREGKIKYF